MKRLNPDKMQAVIESLQKCDDCSNFATTKTGVWDCEEHNLCDFHLKERRTALVARYGDSSKGDWEVEYPYANALRALFNVTEIPTVIHDDTPII